jgi:hypothetical protein
VLALRPLRPPWGAVASIAGLTLLAWALERHAYPSYDYAFAFSAAQDIVHGRETGYVVPVYSPVPHPLNLLAAMFALPLGSLDFPFYTTLTLVALAVLTWAAYRLAARLGGWPAGLLAGAAVYLSPAIFELGARTYGDVGFAAFVLGALVLEVARPKRGVPVMALLAGAGLIRPEAWLLAGAYWLYLFPGRPWGERLRLAAIALAAPVAWAAMDLLLTGDALHSAEMTRDYAQRNRGTSPADTALEALVGWPVLAGALPGALLAWRRDRRATALILATGALCFAATAGPSLTGDAPVLRRYLIVPAAIASVLFAVACLGWIGERAPAVRRAWTAAGLALLLLALVVEVPARRDGWAVDRRAQTGRHLLLTELQDWATSRAASPRLTDRSCWPIRTPGYGYRPYLRYWLDVPAKAVAFSFRKADPRRGAVLLPTRRDRYQRIMLGDAGERTATELLADPAFRRTFDVVARTSRWELWAPPSCSVP